MLGLVIVVAATAAAMALLVRYSDHVFESNRTRVVRERPARRRPLRRPLRRHAPSPGPDPVVWRTLVGAGRD
ncbi:hypothetical protein SAMN05443575_4057 [Jatrophihabitans endophyticus]|uniref:Uncharacterized protein n=2 Tax=Jatrophihabitans endophyticus TaxID=1206085 RepID=A0A1M5TWA5_9ACTN|nr:hypothetical protein SAMN05443575_4057 [Jatrophihabitans endophyticus]